MEHLRYFAAVAPTLNSFALHISSWYPSVKHPSLGNFVRRHVRAINKFFPSVVLHPVALEGLKRMEVLRQSNEAFDEYYVYYPKLESENHLLANFKRMKALQKAYDLGMNQILEDHGKPELIHSHVAYPHGQFAVKMSKALRKPLVITEHWTGYTPEDNDYRKSGIIQKFLTKRIYKHADLVLPVTDHLGKSLRSQKLISNYEVIPNVVDTEIFSNGLAEKSKHRFLHVSNLRGRQKNIEAMLRTFAKLKDSGADFELHLVGEESNENLEAYINRYNLKEVLKLKLQLSEKEVAFEMKSADTLVLFSMFENLPCVLIEGRSTGMNIISSRVGGIAEFFEGQPGVTLIKANDEEALLSALKLSMKERPTDSEREQRHAQAKGSFGADAIGSQIAEHYKRVLNELT